MRKLCPFVMGDDTPFGDKYLDAKVGDSRSSRQRGHSSKGMEDGGIQALVVNNRSDDVHCAPYTPGSVFMA